MSELEGKRVSEAILKINSDAVFSVQNNLDIDNCTIVWGEGTTPISIEDIKVEWDKL
jgi:hypothetical protein|tara:strand:- start:33 stop:203 length:171 start_codon:yes stop_codon:yes gene_type:complete